MLDNIYVYEIYSFTSFIYDNSEIFGKDFDFFHQLWGLCCTCVAQREIPLPLMATLLIEKVF